MNPHRATEVLDKSFLHGLMDCDNRMPESVLELDNFRFHVPLGQKGKDARRRVHECLHLFLSWVVWHSTGIFQDNPTLHVVALFVGTGAHFYNEPCVYWLCSSRLYLGLPELLVVTIPG